MRAMNVSANHMEQEGSASSEARQCHGTEASPPTHFRWYAVASG
jgi:hypothetical protein